jgi:hypothetical protein
MNPVSRFEADGKEAIEFQFVQPAGSIREIVRSEKEHWLDKARLSHSNQCRSFNKSYTSNSALVSRRGPGSGPDRTVRKPFSV